MVINKSLSTDFKQDFGTGDGSGAVILIPSAYPDKPIKRILK